MHDRPVTFASGNFSLLGNLFVPDNCSSGVVMSHGLESDKEGDKWPVIGEMLCNKGIASIRFNHRGCGEVPEDGNPELFENSTLTGRLEDFRAAMLQLPNGIEKVAGIGSSYGGMVVLAAAPERLDAMVLMATPKSLPTEILGGSAGLTIATLPSGNTLKNEFFKDTASYDMLDLINRVDCPVLIIHGTDDEVVPISDAYELHEAATGPKKLIVIKGGDHTFSDPADKEFVLEHAVEWISQNLT